MREKSTTVGFVRTLPFWRSVVLAGNQTENQRGRIVYVEARTGKIKNITKTMASVRTGEVNLVRTDNLHISERAKSFVTRR